MTAPMRIPIPAEPASQPISRPRATEAKSTPTKTPPASPYWREGGRLWGSICAEHTKFVTTRDRLKQPKTADFVLLGGLPLVDAGLLLPPPDHRIRKLHDLEEVHHVHGGGQGNQPEKRDDERPPWMPLAVLVRADEAKGERCRGERPAPQPDVAGRATLRETDVHEAVVQVLAVRDVHGLSVLEPLRDNERGVDDRHRENEQREEEGHDRRGLQKPLERNRGQHEPEQHRARVAHEDPRGIDVVAQEPER